MSSATIKDLCPDGITELGAADYKLESNGAPLLGNAVRFDHEQHSLICTGCVACWDSEIAEREAWERGI